ncbi:MAG TPA: MBL fold metallo-hydrolase [Candidatus Dormibacteraeota bacterium]|nr:MBL fold metallo-hydrolase [Candidatus Dormibacteraeota bacterium]
MDVIVVDVPDLGNRSYIVHDGVIAVVIDPSRRIDEIIKQAKNLEIKAIFETHIHNDYVTGGYALATRLRIPYYVSADDHVLFERSTVKDKQKVSIGEMSVTALASPGHTFSHLSYLVEQPGQTPMLFTGGSLLYGAVGRPDLISIEATPKLAKAQYRTAQNFIDILDPETIIYPTHGFGSFCAATPTEAINVSTLAQQILTNHVYTSGSQEKFVKELIDNLDVYPSYYAYMAPENLKGPKQALLNMPARLTYGAVIRAVHDGSAIIDMRSRTIYASGHLVGTYNIELSNDFTTYVGWLIDWDTPIIVIGSRTEDIQIAQEQLSLIGREKLDGYSVPEIMLTNSENNSSYSVKTFSDLYRHEDQSSIVILDVRRNGEWEKGHITGAIHIPLHELEMNLDKVPNNKQIWVHCAGGFRASIAASILDSAGKKVVLINDIYSNAVDAQLTI